MASSILLLITCGGCTAQYITEEQARESVRAFEGDYSLQFSDMEFRERTDGPAWNHDAWFTLRSGSYPDDAVHIVDASTGEVTQAAYDLTPFESVEVPLGPLTQEDCRQIAEAYARTKYSGFDSMTFHLAKHIWDYTGWRYEWEQTLEYGALSYNYILVQVNPVDGSIEFYRSSRVPVTPVRPPQVTSAQATEIARQAAGIVTITSVAPPMLRGNPDGSSCWRVEITGVDSECYELELIVLVDAETGEVIDDGEPSGGSSLVPTLDKFMVTADDISLRDLAAKVPGAKVHWLGKEGARLFVGKDRYTLVPGKDTIEWTGGTIKLSQKMMLVNGRLMVPSGLLDVLKSASAPKKAPPASAKSK